MSNNKSESISFLLKQGELTANEKEKLLFFLNQQTSLNLFYDGISTLGVQTLTDALKTNNTLTYLDIANNNLGDTGAKAIADALKINKTLTHLDISNNELGEIGAQMIADILEVNTTLKNLDIGYNALREIGTQAIANVLKINNTLMHLGFSSNSIGNAGAQAIADALKVNRSLTRLDISHNFLGDAKTQVIADALKVRVETKSTSMLPMTQNLAESKVANISKTEESLKIKKVLLYLDVSSNKIGNEGLNAFAEMLKVNNSLQIIYLSNNGFDDVSKLGEALKYNTSLIGLFISTSSRTDSEFIKAFEETLQFNISILNITLYRSPKTNELLEINKEIQTNLSERIFECKNPHLSLLDYRILERVNVAVIFKNVWELHQTQQTGKTYEECLREYWKLISLNSFSKNFLFILGICKLNQIPPFRSHLLGIPKEILNHIGSFLNPKDFPR